MYALLGSLQGKEIIQSIVIYVYFIFSMFAMFYFVRNTYIEFNILKCIDYISINKEIYQIQVINKCFLPYQIHALP